MTIDRKSISVVVFASLFAIIFILLVFHRTVTCPDGKHAVVVTRSGLDIQKMCDVQIRREQGKPCDCD